QVLAAAPDLTERPSDEVPGTRRHGLQRRELQEIEPLGRGAPHRRPGARGGDDNCRSSTPPRVAPPAASPRRSASAWISGISGMAGARYLTVGRAPPADEGPTRAASRMISTASSIRSRWVRWLTMHARIT